MLYYYVLYPAAHVRCRVAGDSHELVHTPVSRQISSRSDCGLAMDHCEGTSADAYWPLRVLSFARTVFCADATPRALKTTKITTALTLLIHFTIPVVWTSLFSPATLSCNRAEQ